MAWDIKIEMLGLEEMQTVMKELPRQVSRKILVQSLRRSSRHLVKAARNNVKTRHGTLRKSIGVVTEKNRNTAAVWVGPRHREGVGSMSSRYSPMTSKAKAAAGWYAHFIEFGTAGKKVKAKESFNEDLSIKITKFFIKHAPQYNGR